MTYVQKLIQISGFSIATQQIFVLSPIPQQEVKERLKLDDRRSDHSTMRSERNYLTGASLVTLKYRVFGGKTGPIAIVRVFVL